MNRPQSVYPSSVHGHFGCFQFLAIRSKAAVNVHGQVFVWTYIGIARFIALCFIVF